MAVLRFPKGFLWGTATASYQIEGSPLADGAGPSIWHTFSHTPGIITGGDTGDLTCDHYHRWQQDVAMQRELGLNAYRFSIAWPRVIPTGSGAVNAAGVAFYDRLVDALLEAGIAPMATLYHWDLPQALEDAGGWPEPETAEHYADYAEAMFRALGDRVHHWITFNEPWVFVWLGYGLGVHAPGRNEIPAALTAGHTVLRAHGLAVERFRSLVPQGQIGITLSVQAHLPASDDAADRAAADRARAFHNEWFTDPIVRGDYPAAMRDQFGSMMPEMGEADRAVIAQRIDFLGVNYYTRTVSAHDEHGFFRARTVQPVGTYTSMGWEIYPAGLYVVLMEYHERYGLPLFVTENGAGYDDEEAREDGFVHDDGRMRYIQSHLEMCHRAIADGVDLRGYMAWSLMDNFEWTFGLAKRFGIVRCDFQTLQRTPKLSARWYSRVIAENGI
ncbi:MAG TPA: GH1 family beta-glucosidase [Candidatus Binatia bacterium]|nr:GH1 family beta-glucosidase [Candidatus Binatia bacterium]